MIRSPGRRLMTMRARVTRPLSSATDEYGAPVPDAQPDVLYDSAPCRAWSPTDLREVFDDAQAVAGAVRLTMPLDVDVKQGDTIASIVDRIGRVVFAGPMSVTSVVRSGADKAVMARVQAGGS